MIVFVSNFYNHHQKPLAEKLYKLTDGEFRFIELLPLPDSFKKGGYPDLSDSPLLIQAWKHPGQVDQLIIDADVVLYGNITDYTPIRKRLKLNKLTFEVGERWLKRGWINLLSPRLIKSQWFYHTEFYNKPLYRLCSSAYAAGDMYAMRSFKDKCFKWGYFTEVLELDTKKILEARESASILKILYISRFLIWKHPEMPVYLARVLKEKGIDFELNMFGSGPEQNRIERLIKENGVEDCVHLCGNRPNEEILKIMQQHDIFLFTSDKNEGWGAVLNEAMSNGCAVVASDKIGSAPFLIRDGENGFLFKSEDMESLAEKVLFLINNPSERERMAMNAYKDMLNIWSPENAARRFLQLVESLKNNIPCPFTEGPCSKALPF